jgi:PAS domain-containing protein
MSVSSLPLVSAALNGLALADLRHSVFLEALACQGGCLRGPAISTARPLVLMTSDLLRHVVRRSDAEPDEPPTIAPAEFAAAPLARTVHSLEDLQAALALLGKHRPEDEIDCAGCGYPSCRELAAAILDGAAESRMCVSNMRQQAARKAEAMIRAMPSALVMVDRDLKILEVNEAFVRMFAALPERGGGPAAEPGDALVGAPVSRWLEIGALLRKVLRTGRDVHREHWLLRKNIFNVYAFSVEKFRSAGAIVTDMTSLKAGRAGLARKAREVISKNIATVQEIACLLGEHMVETESILSAIAADFEAADEPAGPLDAGEDGGRPDDADAAADDVGA